LEIVSRLLIWLRAPGYFAEYNAINPNADGTQPSNDDPLQTWKDLSSNHYDFTNPTLANQPLFKTNQQNGNPGIFFSNTKDLIGPAGFLTPIATGVFTLYIVMKVASLTEAVPLFAMPDDFNNRFILVIPLALDVNVYFDFGDVAANKRIKVFEADIYNQAYAHAFQANTPALTIFRNNATFASNNNAGTFTPGVKVPHMGAGISLDTRIFHMVCYSADHNASVRAQVFNRLDQIWGLY
jgi:hypothetical protein